MTAAEAVAMLQRGIETLGGSRHPSDGRLAGILARMLATGESFENALGVTRGELQGSAQGRRDRMLAEIYRTHFAGAQLATAAKLIDVIRREGPYNERSTRGDDALRAAILTAHAERPLPGWDGIRKIFQAHNLGTKALSVPRTRVPQSRS